jgi:hypothetical protein
MPAYRRVCWSRQSSPRSLYADLLRQRFYKACAKVGLNQRRYALDATRFHQPPKPPSAQMSLF